MRRTERRFLAAGLLLAALVFTLGLLNGCASAPPETRCYQAVNGIAVSVDTAMKVAGDLYALGRAPSPDGKTWVVIDASKVLISDAQKAKVISLYEKVQFAESAAGHGCMGLQDAANIPLLTRDVSAAVADLIAFIAQLKGGA